MEKILIIIPARAGSKGIKNKNLAKLGSKKLIEYTMEAVTKLKIPNEICLSTNDSKVIKLAKKYNIQTYFKRPQNLSGHKSSMADVVIHSLNFFKNKFNFMPKYFLLLQPTSPFRSVINMQNIFKKFVKSNKKTMVSVTEVINHPYEYLTIKNDKIKFVMRDTNRFTRRQDFPKVYFINGSVYACKTDYFIKTKKFVNPYSFLYIQPKKSSIDIDNINDLLYARYFLKHK